MSKPDRMCRLCSAADKRLLSIYDNTSESSLGTVYKIETLLSMKVCKNMKYYYLTNYYRWLLITG